MADLLTHVLSAQWLSMTKRQARPRPALVLGVMLPDLIANLPILLLRAAHPLVPGRIPGWLPDALSAFHAPVLYVLLCSWLCALLPKAARWDTFTALCAGGLLHIGVDLLQGHVVPGAYYPAFPLVRQPWAYGFMHTESSLLALPVLVAATLIVAKSGWCRPTESTLDN